MREKRINGAVEGFLVITLPVLRVLCEVSLARGSFSLRRMILEGART